MPSLYRLKYLQMRLDQYGPSDVSKQDTDWRKTVARVLKTATPSIEFCSDAVRLAVVSFHVLFVIIAARQERRVENIYSWLFLIMAYKMLRIECSSSWRRGVYHGTYLILLCSVDFKIKSEEKNWKMGK